MRLTQREHGIHLVRLRRHHEQIRVDVAPPGRVDRRHPTALAEVDRERGPVGDDRVLDPGGPDDVGPVLVEQE